MNRIKELRTKKGITQAELAKKIGVQGAAISKYENEQLQISNEVLKSLALIFEVSIDYILCLTDDPAPIPTTTPTDEQDLETKWNNFLSQLPEDQAMHYQGVEYSDDQKLKIMELARKAKQKKQAKINKLLEYPDEVIDDALIYAAFDLEKRKKMNEED